MSTTVAYSGTLKVVGELRAAFSGDSEGGRQLKKPNLSLDFDPSGGDAPTISGWMYGTFTAAAGDLLLAHASDPLQGMGDAAYSDGFAPAGSKLKYLWIRNTHATESITLTRKTAAGLPIFNADGDAITLAPGDHFSFFKRAGTAALTTTTNDGLTVSISGGAPTAEILAIYGP